MLRHSAIETDRGESTVSVGLHHGRRSLYYRRSCADTIRSVFGRCCHYRSNNGSYIKSIGNTESYKHWTKVWPTDRILIHNTLLSLVYTHNCQYCVYHDILISYSVLVNKLLTNIYLSLVFGLSVITQLRKNYRLCIMCFR